MAKAMASIHSGRSCWPHRRHSSQRLPFICCRAWIGTRSTVSVGSSWSDLFRLWWYCTRTHTQSFVTSLSRWMVLRCAVHSSSYNLDETYASVCVYGMLYLYMLGYVLRLPLFCALCSSFSAPFSDLLRESEKMVGEVGHKRQGSTESEVQRNGISRTPRLPFFTLHEMLQTSQQKAHKSLKRVDSVPSMVLCSHTRSASVSNTARGTQKDQGRRVCGWRTRGR